MVLFYGFVLPTSRTRENWECDTAAINAAAQRAGPFERCQGKVDGAKRISEVSSCLSFLVL